MHTGSVHFAVPPALRGATSWVSIEFELSQPSHSTTAKNPCQYSGDAELESPVATVLKVYVPVPFSSVAPPIRLGGSCEMEPPRQIGWLLPALSPTSGKRQARKKER
jgi:hypothetical protein